MTHAAMYVRVSSQQQKEDATIESQIATLTQFANHKGFQIPPNWIFRDDGVSGATLNRPALEKLRDFVAEGVFSTVFILSPDRLARSYPHQAILLEEFNKQGVEVVFQNAPSQDTPQDKLLLQIQGMFAEYERAQIMERSRRGKKHRAKNGFVSVLSKAPYGYRYISKSIASDAYFEIVDKEALIVKKIFDLYTKERLSVGQIKNYLYAHNIPSPSGNSKWDTTSIANILNKSTYRGLAYFGMNEKCQPNPERVPSRKTRMANTLRKECSSSRLKPKSEWIGISVPAIIENDVYEIAQELLERNRALSKRNTKVGSLLQGLLICKECGYAISLKRSGHTSKKYFYYYCKNREKKCGNRGIRTEEFDNTIWQSITSLLEDPDLMRKEVLRRVAELKNEPKQLKINQIDAKFVKLSKEADRLLEAYQEECFDLDILKEKISNINREKNILNRQKKDLNGNMSSKELLNLEESINYFSKHLQKNKGNLSIDDKRKILRMLVRDIEIGKDEIIVNHIIPISEVPSFYKIALLCGDRVRVKKSKRRFGKVNRSNPYLRQKEQATLRQSKLFQAHTGAANESFKLT